MSDLTQSGQSTPEGGKPDPSQNGLLSYFPSGPGKHPSVWSAKDMNRLVALLRAFQQMAVQISDAEQNTDGTYTALGKLVLGGEKSVLELFLPPSAVTGTSGTANVVPMQVVSYTTTNKYLSAKLGSFTAADTFTATGSAINVALPWELRPAQSPGTSYSIFPAYAANDIIWALSTSAGQNGVYVAGSELVYMDLGLGRQWITGNARRFKINANGSGDADVYGDYFIAKDIDNGNTLTRIAKNFKLRNSITTASIDGTTWSYSYTSAVKRTASTGGGAYTEYQRVSPRYLPDDYILAENVGQTILSGGTLMVSVADTISATPGTAITWIDKNEDGRAWSAKRDQSGS